MQPVTQDNWCGNDLIDIFPDVSMTDFMFLEDTLLPDFNYLPVEVSPPQFLEEAPSESSQMASSSVILSTKSRHMTPSPVAVDIIQEAGNSQDGHRGIRITQEDVDSFHQAVKKSDQFKLLTDFQLPSRSRISRFLNAYFEYFDPHAPIVHHPTFRIHSSPPALTLAMIAIGGIHLSEHKVAKDAHKAACDLIAQFEIVHLRELSDDLNLWAIQATLLCIQFGAFTHESSHHSRSQRQFSLVMALLRNGLHCCEKYRATADTNWANWIVLETFSRLASWMCILNGVILAFDPYAICVPTHQECDLPLPCYDKIWRAKSSSEWSHQRALYPSSQIGLWTAARTLFTSQALPTSVGSFALLALIGSTFAYICSNERLSLGIKEPDLNFIARMEKSLSIWEALWRQHPHAEHVPTKRGDSLMVDCLAFLGSSYYHLYVGKELLALKMMATHSEAKATVLPTVLHLELASKAVRYAASSLLVRAKLGIAHLRRTAALEYGGHALVTAYEGALILSWWLAITSQPAQQVHGLTIRQESNHLLKDLLKEVFGEVEDQGIPCRSEGSERAVMPISFYSMLMQPWVWTYSSILDQRLRSFGEIIRQITQPAGRPTQQIEIS
ncbi:uncharacterized protein A1O5_00913 [Cladophialophora psammophila CBS 110553]|uniref:Xylanolytic transcriptional activator regulatory domain-containing protein n=1 Tax=Cladophialophora psammophila CBS 110553 TaxID=1182543 RepID=W9XGF2_9EURO|nr:uncharacterized protein A1O5_00913 [Cladophialophora psammophila CBS 110553]EXJ76405.1 hypothetical protein A1O5_00913 [Cladophialophora psammophila CBS 110553]